MSTITGQADAGRILFHAALRMRKFLRGIAIWSLAPACAWCVLGPMSSARAAEPTAGGSISKDGMYAGVMGVRNQINGDFDGTSALVGPGEIILIPKLAEGSGTAFVWGGRSGPLSMELNYVKSTHKGTFGGIPVAGEGTLRLLNFDFKGYFFSKESVVQPYLLFGFCLSSKFNMGGAEFSSIFSGFNFGAGLSYYPHPRWALTGGVVYRFIDFDQAKGALGVSREIAGSLSANTRGTQIGLTYTF